MQQEESFRDSIGTISDDGSRQYLFPKKVTGKWTTYRRYVGYLLVAILFVLPWLRINGLPVLQIDVLHRRFIILGQIFWPQDFYLVFLGMLIAVISVALFTVAYGRLFCGWICPQTIFMEHIFRRIEYWIDGDRNEQLRLKKSGWTAEKLGKRFLKNGLFVLISFVISNTFLMYLIGTEEWLRIVTDGPKAHMSGFIGIWLFTGVFFFVFAWFREQVCIIVCPYGRLQGVLLDRNSLVIAYDRIRGEVRSYFKKSEDREKAGKGDCVDCGLCVQVCPTGIDIRNGTQLECTSCTACIDACDSIMDRFGMERGLIRYASESEITENRAFKITARMKAYAVILVALTSLWFGLILFRSPLEATILRAPGQLMQMRGDTVITNLYTYKVLNKRNEPVEFDIRMLEPATASVEIVGQLNPVIETKELAKGSMFVLIPREDVAGPEGKITFGLYLNGELIDRISTQFYGPKK